MLRRQTENCAGRTFTCEFNSLDSLHPFPGLMRTGCATPGCVPECGQRTSAAPAPVSPRWGGAGDGGHGDRGMRVRHGRHSRGLTRTQHEDGQVRTCRQARHPGTISAAHSPAGGATSARTSPPGACAESGCQPCLFPGRGRCCRSRRGPAPARQLPPVPEIPGSISKLSAPGQLFKMGHIRPYNGKMSLKRSHIAY